MMKGFAPTVGQLRSALVRSWRLSIHSDWLSSKTKKAQERIFEQKCLCCYLANFVSQLLCSFKHEQRVQPETRCQSLRPFVSLSVGVSWFSWLYPSITTQMLMRLQWKLVRIHGFLRVGRGSDKVEVGLPYILAGAVVQKMPKNAEKVLCFRPTDRPTNPHGGL